MENRYISGLLHALAYITKTVFCTLNNKKGETLLKKMLKWYFSVEIIQEVADKTPVTNPNQPCKLHCTPEAEEKQETWNQKSTLRSYQRK